LVLDHVSKDAQVVVISDKTSVPLSRLQDLALQNAIKTDPYPTVTAVEQRVVNGRKLLCVTYEATAKTGPTTFYGYFYSGEEGTVEVIAMAPRKLFQGYRSELTDLLNGLEILAIAAPESRTSSELAPGTVESVEIDPALVRRPNRPTPPELPEPGTGPVVTVARELGSTGQARGSGPSIAGQAVPAVDMKPKPLNNPRPNYTEDARLNKVEGFVRVRARVSTEGTVTDVRVITHLPDGLDEEAIFAVKQLRFMPAIKDNQPVAYWVTLEVDFNLCRSAADCPELKQQ
jgi:TonB family protein